MNGKPCQHICEDEEICGQTEEEHNTLPHKFDHTFTPLRDLELELVEIDEEDETRE
jgi:hypothetical protein